MDLVTLINCKFILEEEEFNKRLDQISINLKSHEVESLEKLIDNLTEVENRTFLSYYLNYFHVDYKIPQIGEQFDLIRIGANYNLNIELKSTADNAKIEKQLLRKKHYLKFLDVPSVFIGYNAAANKLFELDANDELKEIDYNQLISIIKEQKVSPINSEEINNLFNPSNYLISPFNLTKEFMSNQYFLTNHQNKIKNIITKKNLNNKEPVLIEGAAGTGKTLLVYDIAKTFIQDQLNVLIIHCANLNSGQDELNSTYSWNITPIKNAIQSMNTKLDIIIVDETQRIKQQQLDDIEKFTTENGILCIYSIDKEQCLHKDEIDFNNREALNLLVNNDNQYNLTKKIRTNKELSGFIKEVFKHSITESQPIENSQRNIQIKHFDKKEEGKRFAEFMEREIGWKHITYSASLRTPDPFDDLVIDSTETPHKVIGQEFEKVILLIDENFSYIERNGYRELVGTSKSYYHSLKMLFQIITRSRKKVYIVLVNNNGLFLSLIKLLKHI